MFREASELDTESVTFKQNCLEVEIEELSFFSRKALILIKPINNRFWWLVLLHFIQSLEYAATVPRAANFFCKGPYNKYFWLCGIYSLC